MRRASGCVSLDWSSWLAGEYELRESLQDVLFAILCHNLCGVARRPVAWQEAPLSCGGGLVPYGSGARDLLV